MTGSRTFELDTVDRSQYDFFELLCIKEDEYGKYWVAQVEKNGKRFRTGNYYCIVSELQENKPCI